MAGGMRWIVTFLVLAVILTAQGMKPEELFEKAVAAQRRQDYGAAEKLYRELLKIDAKSFAVHANLGAVLVQMSRWDEAINEYRAALKLDPSNRALRANLALAFYKKGDFRTAASEFSELLENDAKNLQAAILLGDCYVHLHRAKDAITLLQPFKAENPDNLDLDYALGSALLADGKKDGIPLVEKAAAGKQNAEAWFLAGSKLLDASDFKQARTDLSACVQLNPDYPRAQTLLGIAAEEMGDEEEAIADFRRALALNANDFQANLHMGGVLYSKRDLSAARPFIEKARTIDPDSAFAGYEMALLDNASGNLEKAVAELEKIEAVDSSWIQPHVELAALYYKLHRKADGVRERQIVSKLNENGNSSQRTQDSVK